MAQAAGVIKNRTDFATALLGALGIPNTKNNIKNLVGWQVAEGGAGPEFGVKNNTDSYNPLNTTLAQPGSTPTNSAGVQAYTDWTQGLDATVATLENGDYNSILEALDSNANWQSFATAVSKSPWGTKLTPGSNPGSPSTTGTTSLQNDSSSSSSVYQTGVLAGDQAGNGPNDTPGNIKLTGMAGILQQLDALYNPNIPGIPSVWSSITSLGKSDVTAASDDIVGTITMGLIRGLSAILSIGIIGVGIITLTRGASSSSGISTSGGNVIEFISNAKIGNERRAQAENAENNRNARAAERIRAQREHESNIREREAARTARQREARAAHEQRSRRFSEDQAKHAANKERELNLREQGKYSQSRRKPKVKVQYDSESGEFKTKGVY